MEIELRNVGILEKANVILDGMTVITGFNDSGKSTVGKALYGLYHGMNFYQDSIERDRASYLFAPFRNKLNPETAANEEMEMNYHRDRMRLRMLIESYLGNGVGSAGILEDLSQLKSKIEIILKNLDCQRSDIEILMDDFENRLHEVLQPSFLLKVKKNVVRQTFAEEFSGEYLNLFHDDEAYIAISDDVNKYKVILSNKDMSGIEKNIAVSLNFDDVILIDTPMLLNYMLENSGFIGYINSYNHQQELIRKIINVSEKLKSKNIVENSIITERIGGLNASISKIEETLKVDLVIKNNDIFYEIKGKKVGISSLASGLKTYAIIKLLIDNGYLNSRSLLIIDEPEVHLHPEWQMNIAEILVLLQKEIGIRIMLSTHSPYFLQAIDVYSRKYGIDANTHFYLANRSEYGAILNSIDGNLEATYKMLAKPFITLRDMDNEMSMV